jgi:hypothetical protein
MKTKTIQKGHIDHSIYKSQPYRMQHKFRGEISGIVTHKTDGDPQIRMIPIGSRSRANSEEIYVNLGFCSKIETI